MTGALRPKVKCCRVPGCKLYTNNEIYSVRAYDVLAGPAQHDDSHGDYQSTSTRLR